MKTSNFGEDLSDLHQEKLAALKKLLPNLFDRDGNLLKSELENFTAGYVLEKPEPFMFSWAGKQQAKGLAFKKSKTKLSLKFDEARSKNFDKTQNLIIEGDNLHVLKLLLPSYKGKVKCIYIDPPYNTQNDFIYPDNFAESEKEYLFNSGQIDLDGDTIIDERLETAGRKHSVWLSMMYPRLVLARELLREDGVIFVSIDDNEVHHLRHLMNEVFGESNCTESIIWESKTKSQNTSGSFNKLQPKTEYILCYSNLTKDKIRFNLQYKGSKEYPEIDEKGNFRYKLLEEMNAAGIRGRESMIFPIKGINPKPGKQWQVGQEAISEFNKRGDVFVKNEQVFLKIRARDERSEIMAPFWGLFLKEIGTAESAKKDLDDLMKISNLFDTVKPVELIKRLLFHATKPGDLILDFFAGSGTTGQAVMELNAEEIEKVAFGDANSGTSSPLEGVSLPSGATDFFHSPLEGVSLPSGATDFFHSPLEGESNGRRSFGGGSVNPTTKSSSQSNSNISYPSQNLAAQDFTLPQGEGYGTESFSLPPQTQLPQSNSTLPQIAGRQFILVQAGKGVGYVKDGQKFETAKIDEKKEAYKAGFRYIFDIALERARRAGDKILKNLSEKLESGKNLGKKSAQEKISSNKNQSQMSDLLGFERSEKDSSKTSSLASLAEASSQLDIGFKVMTVTESAVNRKLMNKSTASKEEIFAEIAASYGYGLNYAVREFKNLGEGIFYLEGNDREAMIILGEEQMKNEVLKEIILASDEFSNCQIFAADAVLNVEIIHNLYQHFEQKKVVVF